MFFAYFRPPLPWKEIARRTIADTREDGVPSLAAELAFYFLLSLFPTLLFFVSLLAYVPMGPRLEQLLFDLEAILPQDILRIIRDQIDQVIAGNQGGILTVAFAGALWSSSSAVTAIITALNRAFDIDEWRPWWKRRVVAILLTVALAVFVVVAFVFVVGGRDLARWVADWVGAGERFALIWSIAQWPIAFVLVVIVVDLVYHFAPNTKARWAWVTPGALLATCLWLVTSIGFKVYVENFSNYTAVQGAIGAVIVLMLWFYLSGLALLIGAELDAEIQKAMVQAQSREPLQAVSAGTQ